MHVQEASPLTLITQLCCSIEQRVQSQRTNNINNFDRARPSSPFDARSTAPDLLSFRDEINFRCGSETRPESYRRSSTRRHRRRSAHTSRKSIDASTRQSTSSSSAAAIDFYFRSLLAARPLAAGFDVPHPAAAVGGAAALPVFSSVVRPRPMRPVPRFPAFFPTGSAVVCRPAVDRQEVSNESAPAFGHFRSPVLSSDAGSLFPLNLDWSSPSIELYYSLSRDYVVRGASPEVDGTNRRPSALCWNPSSSVCLQSSPWQPSC